jgi:hypothetical protein
MCRCRLTRVALPFALPPHLSNVGIVEWRALTIVVGVDFDAKK